MDSYKSISVIIVSFKSKDKVFKTHQADSFRFSVIIIENSELSIIKRRS